MSKFVKDLITKELRSRYSQTDNAIWVEMIGIDGITTNQFRRELREKNLRLEVVRNALLRRAVGDGPLSRLADKLDGPAALITGGDSAVEAAKFLDQWLPRLKGMRLRGALLEGEFLDEAAVAGLSKMPTKRDMQARLAGCIRSPGANLASAMLAGGRNIAGCLKSLIEKLEKAPPPAAEAAPAAEHTSEHIEDIFKTAESASRSATKTAGTTKTGVWINAGMAESVIPVFRFGVGQNTVCFVDRLEVLFGSFISGIFVRMILHSLFSERLFYFCITGALFEAENFIKITFF